MLTIGKSDVIYHNEVFLQFYCKCGYVPTANDKGIYTNLWTEDDSQGASECP